MKHKLPYIILFILVLLFARDAHGQFCNSASGGGFSITPSIGCVNEAITLSPDLPPPPISSNVGYLYTFSKEQKDPPNPKDVVSDLSYVYRSQGTYTILQQGSLNGSGFAFCKDIIVKETREPRGELTSCGEGKVQLTIFNDSITKSYDEIIVDWGDGSGPQAWSLPSGKNLILKYKYADGVIQQVTITGRYMDKSCSGKAKSTKISGAIAASSLSTIRILSVEMQLDGSARIIYEGIEGISTQVLIDKGDGNFTNTQQGTSSGGPQTVTIPNLDPKIVYKFKLSSRNVCDNLVESKVVSSVVVQPAVTSLDEINSITWSRYSSMAELIEFQLTKDGVAISRTQNTYYLDTDVKCGKIYKYQLVAIIQGDVRSYSAPIEIEPKTTIPDVISSASVTVSEDNLIETKVELSGTGLTSSYNLVIERSISGSSTWDKISGADNSSLTFQDRDVNTAANSYCYRFSYTNACKLTSPSPSQSVCSILLKGDGANVVWTNNSPFSGGTASYDLIQMDKAGNVREETPKGLSTGHQVALEDEITSLYLIKAFSSSGNLVSYSNKLNFVKDAIVQIPDVFTPNGDTKNDIFQVKSYFTNSFTLSVFNRWGVLIFQSHNSAEGWNGNDAQGAPMGPGYYVYKVDIEDTRGKKFSRNGGFLLIR